MRVQDLQRQPDGGPRVNHVIHQDAVLAGHVPRYLEVHVHLLVGQPQLLGQVVIVTVTHNVPGQISPLRLNERCLPGYGWGNLLQALLVSVVNHGKVQTQIIGEHDGPLGPALIRGHHDAVLPVGNMVSDPAAEKGLHLDRFKH